MKTSHYIVIIGILIAAISIFSWTLNDTRNTVSSKQESADSVEFKVFRAKDIYTGKLEPVYLDLNTIYRAGDTLVVNDNHVIPELRMRDAETGRDLSVHTVILGTQVNVIKFSRDQAESQQ